MPADAGSPTPAGESVETQERFRRPRALIHDDWRRQRLLFMLSLLGLATVFFGFLFFLTWTRLPHSLWRVIALTLTGGLILLIGPSRMYLGAHWLSNVIAAHVLGFIILAFGIEFYLRYLAPREPTEL